MPDTPYLSLSGAKVEAAAGKTRLANCVVHLYQSGFSPTVTSTLADFQANEADYDGYTALTIATWGDPILAGAAYGIIAPTVTFRWAFNSAGTGNQIGGWWIVTAAGDLYQFGVLDPTRAIQGPDQAIVLSLTDVYPSG